LDRSERDVEIACLNCTLNGVTLCPETRKPFDVLAEGLLVSSCRGDKTPLELFLAGVHSLPADLISAAKALATIDLAPQDAYAVR